MWENTISRPKLVLKRIMLGTFLQRPYNLEFIEAGPIERKSEASMSRKDQKLMKILQEGTKLRSGHYQFPYHLKIYV